MRAWQKKLRQLMGVRNKDAFKRIIERMEAIMKMEVQATAHEARMVEVNAVMDTTLKEWETSRDQSEKKAAEYFKYWRKKTGEALDRQHPAALCRPYFCLTCMMCSCAASVLANLFRNAQRSSQFQCSALRAVHAIDIGALSNSESNGMANDISLTKLPAEKWVLVLRKGVNSRGARTTGASEGRHRTFKQLLLFYCPQIHMRRLDHLLHLLFTHVKGKLLVRQLARDSGTPLSLSACFRVWLCVLHVVRPFELACSFHILESSSAAQMG
jgi:hypothetical protein